MGAGQRGPLGGPSVSSIDVLDLPSGRRYRVRYRDAFGRSRSRTFRLKREASAAVREIESRKAQGTLPRGSAVRLSFGEAAAAWLDTLGHLRPTTRANYRYAVGSLAMLDRVPVRRVDESVVRETVDVLRESKGASTVRRAFHVLSQVLDHAMVQGWHDGPNPTRGLGHIVPRQGEPRRRILTVAQVEALAEAVGPAGSDHVRMMAYAGLRSSELFGLTWECVDLDQGVLWVRSVAVVVDGRVVQTAPKSRNSIRDIHLPQQTQDILSRRQRAGLVGTTDLVFSAPRGGFDRVNNWRRRVRWNEARERINVPDLTPHDLRRTYGSLLRRSGADMRLIQAAMGHESITTTARIYAHVYADERRTLAEALDTVIRSNSD